MLYDAARFLIDIVFGLLVYAVLLRFLMQWLRAPFRNPLGQAVSALTDWAVKPLRRILPGYRGYDWASLVLAWLLQALWLAALMVLGSAALSGIDAGLIATLAVVELIQGAALDPDRRRVRAGAPVVGRAGWAAGGRAQRADLSASRPDAAGHAAARRHARPFAAHRHRAAQLVLMLPVAWLEQNVVQFFR